MVDWGAGSLRGEEGNDVQHQKDGSRETKRRTALERRMRDTRPPDSYSVVFFCSFFQSLSFLSQPPVLVKERKEKEKRG